jgi:hypothetical protein
MQVLTWGQYAAYGAAGLLLLFIAYLFFSTADRGRKLVALKRLFAERRLALLTVAGLTVAVAITLSVPLYADAVYGRTLSGALLAKTPADEARPPFAFMFRHLASGTGPPKWDNIQAADIYLSKQAAARLGLPPKQSVRYLATGYLGLFPSQTASAYLTIRNELGGAETTTLAFASPRIEDIPDRVFNVNLLMK